MAMNTALFTIIIAMCPLLLWGGQREDKQYIFLQIDMGEGLSYQVNCMTVSHRSGYAWMGTKNGIGRFDGYGLKKYLNCNVSQLVEDRNNNIWAVTSEGLYRYDMTSDVFARIHDRDGNPVSASSICPWEDGLIFEDSGRLYKYDYKTADTYCLRPLISDIKFSTTNLYRFDNRTLLATNRWAGALLIDIHTGNTRPVPFECHNAITVLTDSKGNFWVAPYRKGVRCYDRRGRLLNDYHSGNSPIQSDIVLALAEYDGRIWIGTDGKGIAIVDPDNGQMDLLTHIPGNAHSLPGNSILSLYADSGNGVWAGSVRNGMFKIKEAGIKLYAGALPNTDYGLSEKSVLSLYQEHDKEEIWVGTDGGGLNVFYPATGKFHHVASTWGDKVASITSIDKKHLLISLFGEGIVFFNKYTGKCTPLPIVDNETDVRLCQQGKTVNLMRNTAETVLLLSDTPYSYNWRKKTFTPLRMKHSSNSVVGQLLPISTENGVSYLHDSKCIYRIDSCDNVVHMIYHSKGDTCIHSATADRQGAIWIGGNYGLGRFSLKGNSYAHIPNMPVEEVMSLISDQHGRLWIGTHSGLFAFDIAQRRFIRYGAPDGVVPNEYLPKPRLLSPKGDIYMGSVNGLLHIDRKLPEESSESPVLELADVIVGGKRMELTPGERHVLKIREQKRPVTVKVRVHNKDIFHKPAYCYNLQVPDMKPIRSYIPELTLNTLTAGTYRITASCSTHAGEWTEAYPIIELLVLPPWYRTWWFILLCMLTILLMAGGSVHFLLRRKENRMKWAMKEHKQQVYEEKVRFLININHELRTPLTLIHAPLKQLIKQFPAGDERSRVLQNIARQSDRMKKLLNMVLDVRKMEVSQTILNIEKICLNHWIAEIIEDFTPEAGQRGVALRYRSLVDLDQFYCDKEKCTAILTNLLVNALKYSYDGGMIDIVVSRSNDKKNLRISISDQGPGLGDVDVSKLFTRFYQGGNSRPGSGIGLSYSKILAELQGGRIGAYDNGELPGSTFWFELPLNAEQDRQILQPQPYLNELLASSEEIEEIPYESICRKETKKYNLLVVDDNMELVEYLLTSLKPYFKEVRVAYDGEEALDICRQWHPDTVVSDIQMPQKNGYELCRQIKEDLEISHIPVILLTARNDEQSQCFGYKNGADVYLTKPFEVETLYAAIYNQLINRERMKENYASIGITPTPEESTFSGADERFLSHINGVITQNFDNPNMGVPFLCEKLGMSRASLYNKLKALTGMGACDYINRLRIDCAAELLVNTSLTVNEIADRVGFTTAKYFSTVFKQIMGSTPTQYKEQQTITR